MRWENHYLLRMHIIMTFLLVKFIMCKARSQNFLIINKNFCNVCVCLYLYLISKTKLTLTEIFKPLIIDLHLIWKECADYAGAIQDFFFLWIRFGKRQSYFYVFNFFYNERWNPDIQIWFLVASFVLWWTSFV